MKRTRLRAKRPSKRRTVHSVPMLRTVLCYKGEELELKPARKGDGGLSNTIVRQTRNKPVSVNLRQLVKGELCYVRHDTCRINPEYTVLAHLRLAGTAGMGQKPDDILALPVCDIAHDMIDGRAKIRDVNFWKEVLCGYLRWLNHLLNEGYLRR